MVFSMLVCPSHDLELHRPTGLLLHNGGSVTDLSRAHHIADLQLDKITAAKLAVDGKVKQPTVSQPCVLVEIEANGPSITRPKRALSSDIFPSIPKAPLMNDRVEV